MKVKELIKQLQQLDPEWFVMKPGYEGGLSDVEILRPCSVVLNVNDVWYYGPHEDLEYTPNDKLYNKRVKAIIL